LKVYELKNDKDVDHLCKELKEVIKQTEKPHLAKIEIKRSKRSIDQNSLLWLWLTCLEKDSETGSSKQDFYDHLIMNYAPTRITECMGESCYNKITTSKMDKKQMSVFMDNVRVFALNNFQIDLPLPEDRRFNQFYETYRG